MFGHGQIEGFSEKYGMEYRYAKWDEQPDSDLIRRHEREIFPHPEATSPVCRRNPFPALRFLCPEGDVNENVFAYSNRSGDERALVVYNNKYEPQRAGSRLPPLTRSSRETPMNGP